MKLTKEVIDQIQEAMLHTKKNGDVNWQDGDEIDVCLAGTWAADKLLLFITEQRVVHLSTTLLNDFTRYYS